MVWLWKFSNVIRSRWSLGRKGGLILLQMLWKKIPIIQPNPFCGFIRGTYQVSIFQRCGTGKKINTESVIEVYEIYLAIDYNQSQELWNIYRHIKRVYIFRIEYDLSFWLQELIKPAVVPENFPPENGPGFNPLTEKRASIECPSRNIPV